MHNSEFRRCLVDCDVEGIRRLWGHISPHLPQPSNDAEALATLHHARTQVGSIPIKLRAYSHRWLLDHGYPSGLPDELKPKAERLYPRIVSAVGVAVKPTSPRRAEEAAALQKAMSDAVADCYAGGQTDPVFVSQRMNEARDKFLRGA